MKEWKYRLRQINAFGKFKNKTYKYKIARAEPKTPSCQKQAAKLQPVTFSKTDNIVQSKPIHVIMPKSKTGNFEMKNWEFHAKTGNFYKKCLFLCLDTCIHKGIELYAK